MERSESSLRVRNVITAGIYWLILGIFLYSYVNSGNPLSLSVVSDRIVDALSISLIFVINRIAEKPLDEHFSYGYHRAETLMNVFVIVLFLSIAVIAAVETTMLLTSHVSRPVTSTAFASLISLPLILIAAFFMESHEGSNFRVMFLHALQDIAIVILTLALAAFTYYTSMYYVGYIGSYFVLIVIIYGNRKIFSRNITVLMEGSAVNIDSIEESIRDEFPNAHHLHVWDMCQHERMATLHLRVPASMTIGDLDTTKASIEQKLHSYGVTHVTIQFESDSVSEA